jgi:MFS family permease
MVTFLVSSISAFLGGTLCDFKGRKITGITGFVLLGISYAVLSVFPVTPLFQILYVLLDSVAWGVLYVTFIFVIWGDLSENRIRERYYLVGGMPFLLSGLIEVCVQPFAKFIPISTSFSFASFFLFLAVLPLLYAPETLPEKEIKDRELKWYLNKAKKVREKYT